MAEIEYEIFLKMVFPPHARWAEEGISAKLSRDFETFES